jgi:hypothetical protein
VSTRYPADESTVVPRSGATRYYFHLCDGDFRTVDEIGNEFESLNLAELAALTVIANLMDESPLWLLELDAPHIEISDGTGRVLSSLPFPIIRKVIN